MYNIIEPRLRTAAILGRTGSNGSSPTTDSSDQADSVSRQVFMHPARRALMSRDFGSNVFRSVSFDERVESSLEDGDSLDAGSARYTGGHGGQEFTCHGEQEVSAGGKANVSMDNISTMTLTEFKSLLNSALTVPEVESVGQGHGLTSSASTPGASEANKSLNWDSLREKARSVRDSLSSSVSARRAAGSVRRSLPQSPDEEPRSARHISTADGRPKTPQALRRNVNAAGATVVTRPKTPTSSVCRPKTPTSGVGRPKTPSGMERAKSEYQMARPKTPSQMKRDAVAKVAGAISNWVESRHEMDASSSTTARPKTPTARPKTPVSSARVQQRAPSRCGQEEGDDDDNDEKNNEVALAFANPRVQSLAGVRERPQTPSRIPKPYFTPRPVTPKVNPEVPPSDPVSRSQHETSNTFPQTSVIARTSSNSSSVKSHESSPTSAAGSRDEKIAVNSSSGAPRAAPRSLPLTQSHNSVSNNSSNNNSANSSGKTYRALYTARRAVTPGPSTSGSRPQPTRSVTPGPREKWTMDYTPAASAPRRSSISGVARTMDAIKPAASRPKASPAPIRRASSAANLQCDMSLTNEITFSDDEEVNEIVRNAARMQAAAAAPAAGSGGEKRARSASVDARKLARQNASAGSGDVLMVTRNSSGTHGVQVVKRNEVKYDSSPKVAAVKRPASRGNVTERGTGTSTPAAGRFRSQTPDPSMFRARGGAGKGGAAEAGDKTFNRTEAWVDSTLCDPKRKLPPRPKRSKGFGQDIPASELEPRPLDEIKAILPETQNGLVHVDTGMLEAPPEDPEMFRKMEKLFEKYREMELRASVNETPGGGGLPSSAEKSVEVAATREGSHKSLNISSRSSPSVASLKTSSGSFVSSSGLSSNVSSAPGSASAVHSAPEGNSTSCPEDTARFRRSASVPVSFHNQFTRGQNSSPHSPYSLASPSQDKQDLPGPSSSALSNASQSSSSTPSRGEQAKTESGTAGLGNGATSLKDIDLEMAKNPTALMSKIKEILRVRPRKDDNPKVPTRIPRPSGLGNRSRSKSVSNLYSGSDGNSVKVNGSWNRELSVGREKAELQHCNSYPNHTSTFNSNNNNNSIINNNNNHHQYHGGSRGNIAYSELVFTEEPEVAEMTALGRAWSVQSDSSDTNQCETPVPKLAMPLTTGRSTFINRRGERMGRSLSQDKENTLSNSQSSLSSRSVLSTTEDDADFV